MVATIDKARAAPWSPRRLREELGFKAGQRLELSAVDGRLEVEHSHHARCASRRAVAAGRSRRPSDAGAHARAGA